MKKGMDNVNRRFKDLDPDKIEEGDIFRTAGCLKPSARLTIR